MKGDVDHYVYLIARRDGERLVAPVKVGLTKDLGSRLASIQTACPFPVALVHSLRVPTRWMAREIENCFHSTQKHNRSHGEWFSMSPLDALSILLMQFHWHLDLNGVSEDIRDQVIEMVGAGDAGMAIVKALRAADESHPQ